MQLLLHAGDYKTGTTSIQSFIKAHGESFRKEGIHVPATGQSGIGNHLPLVAGMLGGEAGRLIEALRVELRDQPCDRVLISTERVKSVIVDNQSDALLDGFRAAGIERFTIIYYLRSPYQIANSSYSQNISAFAIKGQPIADRIARQLAFTTFHYHRLIEVGRRDDVALCLRPYDAATAGSVIRDFLGVVGLSGLELGQEPRLNTAFGPMAIEAMRVVGREFPSLSHEQRMQLKASATAIAADFPEPRSYWGIDAALAATMDHADAQTERLSQFAWGKPWRETIGDARPPMNVFDPATADREQVARFQDMVTRIRQAASALGR